MCLITKIYILYTQEEINENEESLEGLDFIELVKQTLSFINLEFCKFFVVP